MYRILSALAFAIGLNAFAAHAESIVMEPGELKVLAGADWSGELTFRGYEAPYEEEAIPLALNTVEVVDDGVRFGMLFDGATETANREALLVTNEGTHLAGAEIISHAKIGDMLIVITSEICDEEADGAVCERVYRISGNTFSMAKEVILEDGEDRFIRNRYDFTR